MSGLAPRSGRTATRSPHDAPAAVHALALAQGAALRVEDDADGDLSFRHAYEPEAAIREGRLRSSTLRLALADAVVDRLGPVHREALALLEEMQQAVQRRQC